MRFCENLEHNPLHVIGAQQYGWSRSCSEKPSPRLLPGSALFTYLTALHTIKGNLEGVTYTGNFERRTKEDPGNGVSLCMGALRGAPGWGAPLLRTPKHKSEASRKGAFLS